MFRHGRSLLISLPAPWFVAQLRPHWLDTKLCIAAASVLNQAPNRRSPLELDVRPGPFVSVDPLILSVMGWRDPLLDSKQVQLVLRALTSTVLQHDSAVASAMMCDS